MLLNSLAIPVIKGLPLVLVSILIFISTSVWNSRLVRPQEINSCTSVMASLNLVSLTSAVTLASNVSSSATSLAALEPLTAFSMA